MELTELELLAGIRDIAELKVTTLLEIMVVRKAIAEGGVGIPGQRDPDAPCDAYLPTGRGQRARNLDCMGDGHYLCRECVNWDKEHTEMEV